MKKATKTTIRGRVPRRKPRLGVIPTRIERKATAYRRHPKHKGHTGNDKHRPDGFPMSGNLLPIGKLLVGPTTWSRV